MKSHASERFWKCFGQLPFDIQEKAKHSYRVWADNPNHPSLHFKKVHEVNPIYSVRIGLYYRALGERCDGLVLDWNARTIQQSHFTNLKWKEF